MYCSFGGYRHISAYFLTYILIIYQFPAARCENLALTIPNLSPTPGFPQMPSDE